MPFRTGERVGFAHLVSSKLVGATAKLRVWSDRKEKTMTLTVSAPKRLVPVHIEGRPPQYFIHAGLVFTPVTVPYLRAEYGKEYEYEAPVKLLDRLLHGQVDHPDAQIVVLSQVLAADVNIGYEDIVNTSVLAINGSPVRNLRELVQLVEKCKDPFLRVDLDYGQMIALDTVQSRKATRAILETHSIAARCSPDLVSELLHDVAGAANGAVRDSLGTDGGHTEAGPAPAIERTPRRRR